VVEITILTASIFIIMAKVYVGLGSNIEPRVEFLKKGVAAIKKLGKVITVSSLYESEPLGFEAEVNFLNAVLELQTKLTPLELLNQLKEIEEACGRKEKSKDGEYASRELDLDIILYDKQIIITDELVIPHPHFTKRKFVLEPLSEIASGAIDPVSQLNIEVLLLNTQDKSILVKKKNE